MVANDIIWEYFPTAFPNAVTVIYSNSQYQNGLGSIFTVSNSPVPSTANINSVLTILSVSYNDSFYTFKCGCNTLNGCSSFATANITVLSILFLHFFINER